MDKKAPDDNELKKVQGGAFNPESGTVPMSPSRAGRQPPAASRVSAPRIANRTRTPSS